MSCQLSPRRAHSLKEECVGIENKPSPHFQVLGHVFGEKVGICRSRIWLSDRSDSRIVSISGSSFYPPFPGMLTPGTQLSCCNDVRATLLKDLTSETLYLVPAC